MNRILLLLALMSLPGLSGANDSGDCRDCACQHCGCQSHCRKVCHVVCEMKDVKEVCYRCKEEDICIPGKSCKCGEVCECDPCRQICDDCCDHCHDCDGCDHGHKSCAWLDCLFGHHDCLKTRTIWEPACAEKIRTRTKLIKYEVSHKVPTYKWVVEYCCDKCCDQIDDQSPQKVDPPAAKPMPAEKN